jgi:hypothetical protein
VDYKNIFGLQFGIITQRKSFNDIYSHEEVQWIFPQKPSCVPHGKKIVTRRSPHWLEPTRGIAPTVSPCSTGLQGVPPTLKQRTLPGDQS